MRRKGILTILVVSLSMIFCTACGAVTENEAVTSTEETLNIGMSFDSFVIERWQKDRDVFVATAKELGAEVNIQNANGETAEQIAQIEYFIEEKMDVIVVIAIDADALSDVLGRAKEKGIKIISYDRLVSNANADLYISFDNEMVGTLMADYIIEDNPEGGNIIVAYGSKTDNNVEMVKTGFKERIEDSNIEIIHEGYCDGWKPELAYDVVTAGLAVEPDIVGVMCGNDDLASSAVQALAGKRLAGDVTLVGQDGDLLACQRIVEGTQGMTVYKPVEELAAAAATYAVMLAKDELIPMEKTINDGTYEIPYIRLEPIAVTIDNIDEVIIQNGIHNEDEVYLNVSP